MKTIIIAGSSAAHENLFTGFELFQGRTESARPAEILENGNQQLRVSAAGEPFRFQNFIRVADEWKPATLPDVQVITGPSFPLFTSRTQRHGQTLLCDGTAKAEGLDAQPVAYDWSAEITASNDADESWFRFRTKLHLPAPVRLQQHSRVEPQILLWLTSASTLMEGQAGNWRRVTLEQPTRNSLGAFGNDLPAVYMLDQNIGVETMMYFDMSDMAWMSIENLPRFLVYRCTSVSQIERDGTQRIGIGLVANQATGNVLPKGDVLFTFWLLQRSVTSLLTEQESIKRWVQALLPLFEEKLTWPSCASNWSQFAAGTVKNLQDKNAAQVEVAGQVGLAAYVKNTSQLWKPPADNFELMTVADVLWPATLYLQLNPSPDFVRLCDQLRASLPGFYHADTHSISNAFVRPPNERADSWYPFENGLVKYPMIGSLVGSKELTDYFLDFFHTAQKIAQQYNYLFPIYYRTASFQGEGAGTNYAIGGLYAWAAIIAHRLTGQQSYLEEARRALNVLYTVPASRLFHEPQELAYGSLAAAELGLREQSIYLLCQELRMFYWYSDPSQKSHDIRGMAQAAASILYPAFKENVEAVLPWTGLIKRGILFEPVLRFLDQQRRNNFGFFQECSGGQAPIAYVPFENLGTLELGGQTGNVGKEIYGAGECLWMYLMFEGLGQVDDRELMMLNLDLLDTFDSKQFPPHELNFLLYNPTTEIRTAKITIPPAQGATVRLSANDKMVQNTLQVPKRGFIRLLAQF